ncbi:hypothetical protein ElyMa_006805700 [Elysia marginata]|uniref:Uncharacterized protein n=1 Tax=Elysia marginata TaxID=1093978 RepID=A0AAV4J381_9GAST|nr:hypothetical protein ElyMa_006805700 [Elysia marginata]
MKSNGNAGCVWRHGLVVDARLRIERSGVRDLLSAGRRLVLDKGFLHTFLRLTHALNEYPTIGSERSAQNARVMRLTSCSSVSSEASLVGIARGKTM